MFHSITISLQYFAAKHYVKQDALIRYNGYLLMCPGDFNSLPLWDDFFSSDITIRGESLLGEPSVHTYYHLQCYTYLYKHTIS